jgi:O-antigen/teichoic acid export membrane protein
LAVMVLASVWFFSRDYRAYTPSISHVKFRHFEGLMSLGVKFFMIQIIQIVIFSTDNVIISHLLDPSWVTPYTIAYKYFGIITRVSSIICLPFWSAYTEAYVKGDTDWILRTNKKLINIWKMMAVGGLGLLAVSELFYKIWVPTVEVPFVLSCFMYVFVVIFAYGNIFVMFINGVGKIKLQMIFSVFGGLLNIPLSILFAKYFGMGMSGVIFASTICMLYGAVLGPIQFKKIIYRTASGIWNK